MADPQTGQWELDEFVGGRNTPHRLAELSVGEHNVRASNNAAPQESARLFGRTFYGGRTLTLTTRIQTVAEPGDAAERAVWDLFAGLDAAWLGEGYHDRAGEVSALRLNRGGVIRRVYGRPQAFGDPDTSRIRVGRLVVDHAFVASDGDYYDDQAVSLGVDKVPTVESGLGGAWSDPLSDNQGDTQQRSGVVFVDGDRPTKDLEVTFTGPVTAPACEIVGVGTVTLDETVEDGTNATIIVHPAFRSVTVDGKPSAGKLKGTRLRDFALPTGWQEFRFTGTDETGTSEMSVAFRPARRSP